MSTPTIGELERRIADLEAHVEELDERAGLADEPQEYEDHTPSFVDVDDDDMMTVSEFEEAIRSLGAEREDRRRPTGGPR